MDSFQTQRVGQTPVTPPPAVPTPPPPAPVIPPPGGSNDSPGAIKAFYRTNKWYVWAIIIGVAVIGILAFFAFRNKPVTAPQEANVSLSIDAPQTVASGGEVIYKIKAENQDKSTLVHLQLELVYPDGVDYVSSSPNAENLSGNLFSVPDLTPGQNAVVIVKTTAQGDINAEKMLTARLHYEYSNFTSDFTKEASTTLRLVASDVGVVFSGPQTTTNAQLVSYDVSYVNNSDHDITSARLEVDYPDGFTFANASPSPDLAKNIWNVGNLARGQDGKISFQGSFKSAQPGQSETFTANFLVPDSQGNFNTQATNTYATTISSLPLVVSQALDNNNDQIVKPGDTLNYKVMYQNAAAVAATGVNIVLTLDPKSLDLSTIQAEGGEVNSNTITWNASGVSNLENLNPNDSGTLRFSVHVKNPAVKDSSKNVAINSSIKVKSNEYQTYLPGNDLSVKVSSPASVKTSLKSISGQLPLQVGKNTTMQVTVSLTNSTDDFSNAVLTGFIPTGAVYDSSSVNSSESGKVSYDSATGKLTWKVGTLAAHLGDFSPARSLSFNVRVNPDSSQVGQELTLFRTIAFSGKDGFTGEDINLQTGDVTTTQLPDGFNNGRVQP